MSGPSDKAVEAARCMMEEIPAGLAEFDALASAGVLAAYPIIRADVIAEVVEFLRDFKTVGPGTYPAQSNYANRMSYADFIERELGT